MAFARYVVKVPALAQASEEELVRTIGPAVQSYFVPARLDVPTGRRNFIVW